MTETPHREMSTGVQRAKSDRKWLYVAGAIIGMIAIFIVLAGIKPLQGVPATVAAPTGPSSTTLANTLTVEPFQGMVKVAPDCNYDGLMKSVEALDASTVKFTLCQPDVAFLSKIAFAAFGIQSARHLQNTGGKPLEDALGTGPYMVHEWLRDDHLTLVPNPNYWGDTPRTGTVIFKWNKEAAARLTSLKSGEADGIDNPDPNDFKPIAADKTLKLYPREALNIMYLGMNSAKKPFDNEKVRQAIAVGIDRKAIIGKYYPPGSIMADYFTPCAIPGGCEGDPWYTFDQVAAKKLLTDAGFPNGFKTNLSYRDVVRGYLPSPGKVAEEIQAQLKKNLGIDATIDLQESGTFLDNASNGNLELFLLGWNADYPDQTDFLGYHFGKGANAQFGGKFGDLSAILARAATLADQTERNKLYAQANALVKQHAPMVPIAHGGSAVAFKATVAGAYSDPLSGEQFRLMNVPGQDQIVWIQNAEPISLYCPDETDSESVRACAQIFDTLLSHKPGGIALQPGLATECASNNGLTEWTCKLRQGVKFSDGTPVTANDVVATFAVQWDAADPLHVGRSGNFDNWSAFFDGFLNVKK